MRFSNFKQDQGVAGLSILLSLVVMLFIIGLIVMIFSLMGASLSDATYDDTAVTVSNESGFINSTGYTLDLVASDPLNWNTVAITEVRNESNILVAGNYTLLANGTIYNATAIVGWMTPEAEYNISYTYQYDASNTATDTINDTTSAIAGVTDWFSIFVVIGAMVVLILLTVIIITAIRGSGMIQSEGGNQNIGSA